MRTKDAQERTGFLEKRHFYNHFMHDIQKKGSAGKHFSFFFSKYLSNYISNENFTHRYTQTGIFFPKSGNFFPIFKKDKGYLLFSPARCTPNVIYFLKRG